MPVETILIQKISQFSDLTTETKAELARRSFTRSIPPGNAFIIEGSPAESCYFILKGEVRVLRMNTEGRVQVLARLQAGAPINIISLLSGEKRNHATVETLTPVTLLVFSATDFDFLTSHFPDFSRLLLELFAQRLSLMTNLAADLSLYSVRARLARFLIELADLNPSPTGWTQDEIAAHIGTVRDVVGRLLRDFESAGLIQRQRGTITLLKRDALIDVAESTES